MATVPDTLTRDEKLQWRPLGPRTVFDDSAPRPVFGVELPGPKGPVSEKLVSKELPVQSAAPAEHTRPEVLDEAPVIPPRETFQEYIFHPARSRFLRYELLLVYACILAGSSLLAYSVRHIWSLESADTRRDASVNQLRASMQGTLNRNGQAMTILDRIGARLSGFENDIANLRSGLTSGLASSSSREARIEAELKLLDARIAAQSRQLQALSARPVAPASTPAPAAATALPAAPVVIPAARETGASQGAGSFSASPASEAHKHEFRSDITVPSGADVRVLGHGGVAWLLSIEGEANTQVVRPYGQTKNGVQVHNQNNGRDYLITPNGWISIN